MKFEYPTQEKCGLCRGLGTLCMYHAHKAGIKYTDPIDIRKKEKPTREAVVAQYKAAHGDQLGPAHIGMLTALTADFDGPHFFTKTRQQRRTRRRLLRYIANPDFSGLSAPSEEDWRDFPDLYEEFKKQQGIK